MEQPSLCGLLLARALPCVANSCTAANASSQSRTPAISLNGCYGIFGQDRADHSALMVAARITLPHFSVSSVISLPNRTGDPGRAFILGSSKAALTSLLSLLTISAGVAFGTPRPYQLLPS